MEILFEEDDNCPRDEHRRHSQASMVHQLLVHMETILESVLHDFQLQNSIAIMPNNLEWWMFPCSTTYFSRFVIYEFDNMCWIWNFRMPKRVVFLFASILSPYIEKKDTSYHRVVPVTSKFVVLSLSSFKALD